MWENEKDGGIRFPIVFPNAAHSISMTRATYRGVKGENATAIQAYNLQPGSVTITNPGPETYVYYIAVGS